MRRQFLMRSETAPRRKIANRGTANDVVTSASSPTHDEIARRAFEIFLKRGGNHGNDLEDWLQAEKEVSARASLRES
jgi:hypothetical protein